MQKIIIEAEIALTKVFVTFEFVHTRVNIQIFE